MNLYLTKTFTFTFLGQGSYEITGGVGPTPLGIQCGSKPVVSEGLKNMLVNILMAPKYNKN